ncbi:MAG: anthranilate synthase component I [Gloeomargarita sp. SKYB31]|nr:anthranilate synthase component I [Gloeomargarita sp. SKYB31]
MNTKTTLCASWETFQRLSEQGNFIPVYATLPADLDTPVSAWYRVCRGRPYSFLLESVEGGERIGRYSVLGCDPLWVLTAWGDTCEQVFRDGTKQVWRGSPFEVIPQCLAPYQPVSLPELPPGLGGLFGFWGYELIRWIEPTVPVVAEGDLPDGCWLQMDHLLVFDQVRRQIWVVAYGDTRNGEVRAAYEQAKAKVEELLTHLQRPLSPEITRMVWQPNARTLDIRSDTTAAAFQTAVRRAKDYIHQGDIFQVVLSQELSTPYTGDPFLLYRSLRLVNPSPYMAFFQFGDWQLVGSSPEVMVKTEGRIATVRPIAGTRPRGATPEADARLAEELRTDPKEVAEHVMLVDLARNDLGRVAERGTVRVDEMMVIERYSHVMHIVSNVVAKLAPGYTAWDALKACFPAGTVSGAPKIRAMQIIYELEHRHRGPYAGCYGYYDFEGQLNTAITLRTMVVHQGWVRVRAGAGVVADSDPEREYQETWNKAKGLLAAIAALGE